MIIKIPVATYAELHHSLRAVGLLTEKDLDEMRIPRSETSALARAGVVRQETVTARRLDRCGEPLLLGAERGVTKERYAEVAQLLCQRWAQVEPTQHLITYFPGTRILLFEIEYLLRRAAVYANVRESSYRALAWLPKTQWGELLGIKTRGNIVPDAALFALDGTLETFIEIATENFTPARIIKLVDFAESMGAKLQVW